MFEKGLPKVTEEVINTTVIEEVMRSLEYIEKEILSQNFKVPFEEYMQKENSSLYEFIKKRYSEDRKAFYASILTYELLNRQARVNELEEKMMR